MMFFARVLLRCVHVITLLLLFARAITSIRQKNMAEVHTPLCRCSAPYVAFASLPPYACYTLPAAADASQTAVADTLRCYVILPLDTLILHSFAAMPEI